MMRLFSYIAMLSLFGQMLPAEAFANDPTSLAQCQSNMKMEIPQPSIPEDKYAASCKNSQQCKNIYKQLWSQYHYYQNAYGSVCSNIYKSNADDTGVGTKAFGEAKAVADNGKTEYKKLSDQLGKDIGTLDKSRQDAYKEAAGQANNSNRSSLTGEIDSHKGIKELKTDDDRKSSMDKYRSNADLAAASELVRFQTGLRDAKKKADDSIVNLSGQSTANDDHEKKGGTAGSTDKDGFGWKDALALTPLAAAALTAGAGLLMAQKNQSGSSADTSGLNSQYPTPPNVSDLSGNGASGTDTGTSNGATSTPGTNLGDSSGGTGTTASTPSFTAGTDTTTTGASFDQGKSPDATVSPPANAATTDPTGGAMSAFNGNLGGTPFSGSATSGFGAAGGGSSGALGGGSAGSFGEAARSLTGADNPTGASSTGKAEENLLPSGGSAPGFAGGASHTGSSDPTLKDLFKSGDPFAAPGGATDGKTPEGAFTGDLAGADGHGTSTDVNLGTDATGSSQLAGDVPGANDARTLFARVRESHTRCLKRGCVTSEAGGKI